MNTKIYFTMLAALLAVASTALAQDTSTNPAVFPSNGKYVASAPIVYANGVTLNNATMADLHYPGVTSLPQNVGDKLDAKSFFDVFVDITVPPVGPASGIGNTDTIVQRSSGTGDDGTFTTQMTQLDMSGLSGGAMIRLDPNAPSTGQTTITDNGNGTFQITSFFDIFTDISLDGGNTWAPSTGPAVVTPSAPDAGETLPMLLIPVTLLALGAHLQKNRA